MRALSIINSHSTFGFGLGTSGPMQIAAASLASPITSPSIPSTPTSTSGHASPDLLHMPLLRKGNEKVTLTRIWSYCSQSFSTFIWKARRKEKDVSSADESKEYLQEELLQCMAFDMKLAELVELPRGLLQQEWIASHTIAFFDHINLVYGTISEFCTMSGCPDMNGPCNRQYFWTDERGKRFKIAAPQYIDYVMTYTQKTVNDESIFPTKFDKDFPCSFETIVRKILRLLFHVLAHIYHVHFKEIVLLGLHSHLNCIFAHLILFNKQFALLEAKELEVLHDLAVALRLLSESSEPMQCATPSPTPEPTLLSSATSNSATVAVSSAAGASSSSSTQSHPIATSSCSANAENASLIETSNEINLSSSSDAIEEKDIIIQSGRGTPMESESLPSVHCDSSAILNKSACHSSSSAADPNDSGVITTQCRSISPFANAGSLLTLANVASEMSSNVDCDSGRCDSNASDDCPMQAESGDNSSQSICDSQPTAVANHQLMQQFSVPSSTNTCLPGGVQSVTSGYWSLDEPQTDGSEKRQLEIVGPERRVHKRKSFGELGSRAWLRESSNHNNNSLVRNDRTHSFDREICNQRLLTQATGDWPMPIAPIDLIPNHNRMSEVEHDSLTMDQCSQMAVDELPNSLLPSTQLCASTSAIDSTIDSTIDSDAQSNGSILTNNSNSRHRVTQSFGCLQLQPESGAL